MSRPDPLDATEPYDVCVVGAGLAGGTLAQRFAAAGLRALLVEGAPRAPWGPGLAPRSAGRPAYPISIGGDEAAVLGPSADAASRPPGPSERFDAADFAAHPYARRRPWPLRYADLEPYYARAETTLGRRLARSPSGFLVHGARVARLHVDRNGRVIGAACRMHDGAEKTARAQTFVLACGAVETPRLLLLSRSRQFARGVGNDFGRVGLGLGAQAAVRIAARLDAESAWPETHACRAAAPHALYHGEGLGSIALLARRKSSLGRLDLTWLARRAGAVLPRACRGTLELTCRVELEATERNRLVLAASRSDPRGDPTARVEMTLSPRDTRLIGHAHALLARWLERAGAAPTAAARTEWAGELFGTCVMGEDPAESVCDRMLRVHASPNLYLCGPETLPTAGALPPTLTVVALAHRLADHLVERAHWCERAAAVRLETARRRGGDFERATAVHLPRRQSP